MCTPCNSPTTVAGARAAGSVRYFTGNPCKHGHIAERYTKSTKCIECEHMRLRPDKALRYQKNRNEILAKKKADRVSRPDFYNARQQNYRALDPTRNARYGVNAIEYQQQYYAEHADQLKISIREWRKNNPEKIREYMGRCRAARLLRVPTWLSKKDKCRISTVYAEAVQLTKSMGVPHHVDHIIPLQGVKVSGLHVPGNLQVLTARENLSKGNNLTL